MRRAVLPSLLLLILTACAPFHLAKTRLTDRDNRIPIMQGYGNDAGCMSLTPLQEVVRAEEGEEGEAQLREMILRAGREGWKVSIAGSRHSMGGHTLYPGGVALDMRSFDGMEMMEDGETLRVGSGATWAQVIPFLDERGRSVWVMQSNNDFTVGGSLSVNCHGWQHRQGPISSTVESFRLLKANGDIVRCSRDENAELFSLVLGGYGLFGVILDADLKTIPDTPYRFESEVHPSEGFTEAFRQGLEEHPETGMMYGRLSVDQKRFLREAMLNLLVETEETEVTPLRDKPSLGWLRRSVFRGSAGSDYGKRLRWNLEKKVSAQIDRDVIRRNQVLHESADVYADRAAGTVDILQEYFVPQDRLNDFLDAAREIIPRHKVDLLNVTIRDLVEDRDTVLRYADQEMFALVMLIHQDATEEADAATAALARDLIDAALSVGGRYYLPYRLHATQEQFHAAYPQAAEFFEAKRRHDPQQLFQNWFYLAYGTDAGSHP